ncbi:hypothetical protein [Sporosarcina sp. SAFN-015]|uniref:hypothetical protein n=1 Tax=Sporosarcina sp. SAFN-015 TaxID=3387274 RepID=UPI003F7D1A87
MTIIQPVLTDTILNLMDDILARGKVKIDGVYKDYEIFKSVQDGNTLRKYIYLQSEEGLVQEAQLLSTGGDILATKPFSISKQDDGLILAFEFSLTIQEG